MKRLLLYISLFTGYVAQGQINEPTLKDNQKEVSVVKNKVAENTDDSLTNLQPNVTTTNNFPTPKELPNNNTDNLMSTYEFGLSVSVLAFGLLIIILEIFLLKNRILKDDLLVKFILVTLIITATLFLITAGYDNNQIAPAIGLFGTVAGYLLGKSSSPAKKSENEI